MSRRRRSRVAPETAPAGPMTAYPTLTFADIERAVQDRIARPGAVRSDKFGDSEHASIKESSAQWDGGMSISDTLTALRRGWEAGNVEIAGCLDVREADAAPNGGYGLDVAGDFPCVPAYIAGDPECMYRKEPGEAPRRVRLVTWCWYTCHVDAERAMEYAKATATFAGMLMARGFDVAITSMYASRSSRGARALVPIAVKEYGQEPDASRIAFSTHPAFMRRALFAYFEVTPAMPVWLCSDGYARALRERPADSAVRDSIPDANDERMVTLPSFNESPECATAEEYLARFLSDAAKQAEGVQS